MNKTGYRKKTERISIPGLGHRGLPAGGRGGGRRVDADEVGPDGIPGFWEGPSKRIQIYR